MAHIFLMSSWSCRAHRTAASAHLPSCASRCCFLTPGVAFPHFYQTLNVVRFVVRSLAALEVVSCAAFPLPITNVCCNRQ